MIQPNFINIFECRNMIYDIYFNILLNTIADKIKTKYKVERTN